MSGFGLGFGLGLARRVALAAGVALPAAVIAAGAQAGWNLQFSKAGPRVAATKIVGTDTLPTGWALSGSYAIATNSNSSLPLVGWDLNGRTININHSNVTVADCTNITNAGNPSAGNGINISTSASISNVVVEYNWVDGLTSEKIQVGIACHGTATLTNITIRGNRIGYTRDDQIKGRGANLLVELNYLEYGAYKNPPAHWDSIDITNPGGTITVQDNFCNVTPLAETYGRTSSITLSQCPAGGVVRRNIMGFGAAVLDNLSNPAFYAFYSAGAEGQTGIASQTAGVTVENNVMEWGLAAMWPTVRKGIISPSTANYRLSTGAAISETWSTTDNVPDAFAFTDVVGAVASTLITSDNITLTGLTPNSQVYVLLPNGTSYSLNNGGVWSTAGANAIAVSVGAGGTATLRLRQTSSATPGGVVSILVTAGGTITDTWTVTTA
jgi:hypothetical protein